MRGKRSGAENRATHILTARATDDLGAVAEHSVSIAIRNGR